MTPEELEKAEQEEFNTGPLSVLTESVKNNTQVGFRSSCGLVWRCPLRCCIKLQLDLSVEVPSVAPDIGTSLSIHFFLNKSCTINSEQ
jgi:hypothetical protein